MTDKERLEMIKGIQKRIKECQKKGQNVSNLHSDYVDWLLNRIEELEEREKIYKEIIQSYGKIADGFVDDIESLVKRNEHYKQALEEIARGRFPGASYKARQALESEK